jgi:hypothetical protein
MVGSQTMPRLKERQVRARNRNAQVSSAGFSVPVSLGQQKALLVAKRACPTAINSKRS